MSDMTAEAALALRKPFPRESIGQLPKGGAMLDYVGHAAVTDRLLTVDPNWSWEPFALGPDGLPAVQGGNLWIRLTVCGVTRIGVGDGKNPKECIGDAIRNAAMRFGVALDLWAKENLVEFAQAATAHQAPTPSPAYAEAVSKAPAPDDLLAGLERQVAETHAAPLTAKTRGQLFALFAQKGVAEDQQLAGVNHINGTAHESRSAITEGEAKAVIAVLKTRPDATAEAVS